MSVLFRSKRDWRYERSCIFYTILPESLFSSRRKSESWHLMAESWPLMAFILNGEGIARLYAYVLRKVTNDTTLKDTRAQGSSENASFDNFMEKMCTWNLPVFIKYCTFSFQFFWIVRAHKWYIAHIPNPFLFWSFMCIKPCSRIRFCAFTTWGICLNTNVYEAFTFFSISCYKRRIDIILPLFTV